MKKTIILLLTILLIGCTSKSKINLKEKVTVDFYYVQSCGECEVFKKKAIPLLEKTYENIEINLYDLDDETVSKLYDLTIQQLKDFDEAFYGTSPFIVVEDYFALIGYTSGDNEYLVKDIEAAVKGEPLSDAFGLRRVLYQ